MLAILQILVIWPATPATGQTPAPEYLIHRNLRGKGGGSLVASISADLSTFNRMLTSSLANSIVADRLAGDLVHINRATFELEPALASRWQAEPDGRTYTLYLRRGLRFSDGSPFTADDVIFSFQVLQDPKVAADQSGQILVDGAFPVVSKLDQYTVRISFPRPVGMGLRALDSIPMLPRHLLQKAYLAGNLRTEYGPNAKPEAVVGMGPFKLKEHERGVKVVLERNPYYWKRDGAAQALPYLDTLTFLILPDRNAEALRFQNGEIDIIYALLPENYASLQRYASRARYQIKNLGPGLGMDFLWFNLNPGRKPSGAPFVDPEKAAVFQKSEFRRAISIALNRDGMNRSIYLGLGEPQRGPVSSGNKVWLHPDLPKVRYEPARARQLLAQCGLRDTNRDGVLEYGSRAAPFEINIHTARGRMDREKMAQVIKDNLSAIGIRVNLQFLLINEIAARFLGTFDYEAILFGITPTDIVPDLQTDLWYSSGRLHFWFPNQERPHYAWEAEIDALTSRLVRALDPAARREAFNRIQEIWAVEMPAIPTIAPNILVGWKNGVGNVNPSILVPYILWNAEELTVTP